MKELNNFFASMNFKMLKAQKLVLIAMAEKKRMTKVEVATIEGMLSLIDNIQNIAVDVLGMDKKEVTLTAGRKEEVLNMSNEEAKRIVLEDFKN